MRTLSFMRLVYHFGTYSGILPLDTLDTLDGNAYVKFINKSF